MAPTTDIFWQTEDSDQAEMLREIMQVVPLKNENHYKTDFNNFMQLYKSLAASLFKEWEESQKI